MPFLLPNQQHQSTEGNEESMQPKQLMGTVVADRRNVNALQNKNVVSKHQAPIKSSTFDNSADQCRTQILLVANRLNSNSAPFPRYCLEVVKTVNKNAKIMLSFI